MHPRLPIGGWREASNNKVLSPFFKNIKILLDFRFIDEGHTAWYHLHDITPSRHTIPLDVQKSSSWLLFHQALYHTYCHHDADGYSTWTQVLKGLKFWVFIRPPGYEKLKSRREIFEACLAYLSDSPDVNGYYGKESERFIVYASPGDII